jgi:hypothetical protein
MKTKLMITALAIILTLLSGTAPSFGFTGRKAVLYTRGEAMLAENLPWKQQDCSSAAWRMMNDLWPELKLTRWFHRTTADAMAGWPWEPLMSLDEADFGDLLFVGKPKISHLLIHWDRTETAVHAAKSRGFSKTKLRPYWLRRITVAIRPPY